MIFEDQFKFKISLQAKFWFNFLTKHF